MLWNMGWKIIIKFIILYQGTKVDWLVTNVVTKLKILKILLFTENLAFKNFSSAKFVIVDLPPNKAAICIQEVSSYRVSHGKMTNFRPTYEISFVFIFLVTLQALRGRAITTWTDEGGGGKRMAKLCPRSCWMPPTIDAYEPISLTQTFLDA